ncbi:MAG: YceI family protein [Burkholderiaceae bacterium]|nr:YceI family protein [Burkholderiaceae bacterium]
MKRFIACMAMLTAFAAHAAEYNQVQLDKSAINFTYQQMGVKMDGKFKKFAAKLSFDPAKPSAAKAVFDVDLASIDTGSDESDQEVAGKAWFNTKAFPVARFVSGAVKSLGGNKYEVLGQLTIKGKTQEVVVPATFTAQGKGGVFDGAFVIRRGDFSIGEGAWAKFDILANDIQIKFRINASSH